MIFKKNKQVTNQPEPFCNADKNTSECSLIGEIHELQNKRDKYNERLKICKLELEQISMPIASYMLDHIRFSSRYRDTYDLADLVKNWNTSTLMSVSEKLVDIANLKREPEYLESQIYLINQKIAKLKEQLNIQ
jgi:chromosome segregation ATPase